MIAHPSQIDPTEHLGLAHRLALEAAGKYGGSRDDWLGTVWEAVQRAAQAYKPERGRAFTTYAWAAAGLACYEENRRRQGEKRTSRAGKKVWVTVRTIPLDEHHERLPGDGRDDDGFDLPGLMKALTPTERKVARMVGRGLTRKRIADHLGMSVSAVTRAMARVRALAEIRRRVENG